MLQRPGSARARRTAWRAFAEEIGAEFMSQRHQRPDTVQLKHEDVIITMDPGERVFQTRLRCPFVNLSDFKFLIYTAGPFSSLGRRLVLLQDLDIGHPGIDRRFVVQSARPNDVRDLFRNERVRDLVWEQASKLRLGIAENDGLLGGSYPGDVDLLHITVSHSVTDLDRLKGLFELFQRILAHVSVPPGEDEVERHIRRLGGPGGIITGKVTLWEGGPHRHDAADELARLRDPRSFDVMLDTLHDLDPVLKAKAAYALGEIGDERAIPTLVRLLGVRQGPLTRKLCDDAADALEVLGEIETVEAFLAALEGDPSGLQAVAKRYRPDLIEALITSLEGPGRVSITTTVQALARIGAVEALPELRKRLNNYMLASVRDAYQEAIDALEERTSLPRPAAAGELKPDTLPRPADGAPAQSKDTLPKATDL